MSASDKRGKNPTSESARSSTDFDNLEEISENLPAAIGFVRLPEQVYVFANRVFRELVGDRQLVGKSFQEVHPEACSDHLDVLDKAAATGDANSAGERAVHVKQRGDIPERYFDFVYQPMRSEAGQYEAILIFAVDVTEKVRVRMASEELTRELEGEKSRLEFEVAEHARPRHWRSSVRPP